MSSIFSWRIDRFWFYLFFIAPSCPYWWRGYGYTETTISLYFFFDYPLAFMCNTCGHHFGIKYNLNRHAKCCSTLHSPTWSAGFQTCHISSHGCPPDSCQILLDSGRVKTDWGPQSGVQWSPPESAGLCRTVELKVDYSPQRGSGGVCQTLPDSARLWS